MHITRDPARNAIPVSTDNCAAAKALASTIEIFPNALAKAIAGTPGVVTIIDGAYGLNGPLLAEAVLREYAAWAVSRL